MEPTARTTHPPTKLAGMILIVASLVAMLGILKHPTPSEHIHGHTPAKELLAKIHSRQFVNATVHGTMIVVVGLFVLANSYLASLLGLGRVGVRAGLIAYGFGALSMAVAATVGGFVVHGAAERIQEAGQELFAMEAIGALLGELNGVAALLGVIGMSLGVLFWSLGMLYQSSPWRVCGSIGLCVGIVGIVGVLTGHLNATLSGMIFFVTMQLIWNVIVGSKLFQASPQH